VRDTRRFKTRLGFREPPVKALEELLKGMSSRESAASAKAKIRRAIETGGEIDLDPREMAEVVADIRRLMQGGRVDREIAGIRHDEFT
jgi:hypothetical protein